jgi:hypothetical protein
MRVNRAASLQKANRLQVFQSKCPCFATNASQYVSDRQIHEDLGVTFFADHIRALTESLDSYGEPLSLATWKALVPTKGRLKSPAGNRGGLTQCSPVEAAPKKAAKSMQLV